MQLLAGGVLGFLFVAGVAIAQSPIVSPSGLASTEGLDDSRLPLLHDTPRRFLQIHSDLGTTAGSIKKIAFRRDAAASRGAGTRQVECELHIGPSVSWDKASYAFAANFIGTRTKVLARRFVNLPALSSVGNPPTFELGLTFDAPWAWAGSSSLAWDLAIFSARTTGTYATGLDGHYATTKIGSSLRTGVGCYASGRSSAMTHTVELYDAAGTLTMAGMVADAPANAACVWMIGIANPSTVYPGLCSPFYTDMILGLAIGTSDATGFIGASSYGTPAAGGSFAFVFPNTAPNVTLFTQVHAVDPALPFPIPIANSDGRATTIPEPDRRRTVKVTRLYSDDGKFDAQRAIFIPEGNVGYGTVTQFSF